MVIIFQSIFETLKSPIIPINAYAFGNCMETND